MWGLLQILDYHHWQNGEKMRQNGKQGRGKCILCYNNPKTVSLDRYNDEMQESLLVEQLTDNAAPDGIISGKAHIEGRVARERSARSRLQRAASIHNLETTGHGPRGLTTDWGNPIIILHKGADTLPCLPNIPNAQGYPKQNKSSDAIDFLETFRANQKLFMHILQHPDAQPAKNFHVGYNAKARLKKSGSFPAANSSNVRLVEPATLEQKQNEIWPFPKRVKSRNDAQTHKFSEGDSLEDSHDNSTDLKADARGGANMTQRTSLSFLASPQGSNRSSWHQSLISHIKHIQRKIKFALKRKKRKNNHTSMIPSGGEFPSDENEACESLKEIPLHQDGQENPRNVHETNGSDDELSRSGLLHTRRSSSLNESLDGYSRLFECSFKREGKWHQYHSKSLKLTNEDKFPSGGYNLKSIRRRLSLSDVYSFVPLPNDVSIEKFFSEMSVRTATNYYDTSAKSDSHDELKSASIPVEENEKENVTERGNYSENNECLGGLLIGIEEGNAETEMSNREQEFHSKINSCSKKEEEFPDSNLHSCFQNERTGSTELPVLKGSGIDSSHIGIDELDSFVISQDKAIIDHSLAGTFENCETASLIPNNHILQFELHRLEDPDFKYVRDVLELSGFTDPDHSGTWHSLDHPLSPTLFNELEAYLHHESECSSEDVAYNCNHQLLFDLINEELLEIYETSLGYFPKPFSFSRRFRPLPKGNRVPEEVWKRISWFRDSSFKKEKLVEDIVAEDLEKGEGWMNLYLDIEDVALDLEELISDEIIDEIMYSRGF